MFAIGEHTAIESGQEAGCDREGRAVQRSEHAADGRLIDLGLERRDRVCGVDGALDGVVAGDVVEGRRAGVIGKRGGDHRRCQAFAGHGAGEDPGGLAGRAARIRGDGGEGVVAQGERDVEEDEQAVCIRLRDGAGLLQSDGDVGVGLADEVDKRVVRHVVADRRGVGVDIEVERRLCGRGGKGRRWRRVEAKIRVQEQLILGIHGSITVYVSRQAVASPAGRGAQRRGQQRAVGAVDESIAVQIAGDVQVQGVVAGRGRFGARDCHDVEAGLVDQEEGDDDAAAGVHGQGRAVRRWWERRGRKLRPSLARGRGG